MRKLYKDASLQIIFSVTLMSILGATSIPPAYPRLMSDLQLTSQSVQLVLIAFAFPGVFITPILGIFSDRVGRKSILIPSLFLFGFAGGACALAPTFEILLVLRVLQGIGAAPLGALNVTLVGDLYTEEERSTALGYNLGVLNTGAALFPILGGALAIFGWFYPFLIPFVAIPIGIIVIKYLKNPEPKEKQEIKVYLKESFHILKKKEVLTVLIAVFFAFLFVYGPLYAVYPLILEGSFGASTFVIGLIISVEAISAAIVSWQMGKIKEKISEQTLIKVSMLFYASAFILIPFLNNIYLFLIPCVLLGVGFGINITSIQLILTKAAPLKNRAILISIYRTVMRWGQTTGPFLIILLLFSGFFSIYIIFTFFALGSFVLMVFLLR